MNKAQRAEVIEQYRQDAAADERMIKNLSAQLDRITAERDGMRNPTQAMIDRGADVMALHLFGYAKAMQSDREAFEMALRAALATSPLPDADGGSAA